MDIEFDLLDDFINNMSDLIKNFTKSIALLENDISNKDSLNELFRAAHSIKGMSATMEFNVMENLTHKMEDLCALVRDNKIEMNNDIVDIIKECYGQIVTLFSNIENYGVEDDYDKKKIDYLLERISNYFVKKETNAKSKNKGFEVSEENKEIIEKKLSENLSVKKIEIVITDECPFKKIRGYMAITAAADLLNNIFTYPTIEDLLSEEYEIEGRTIICITEGDKDDEVVKKAIYNVTDIENVNIEKIYSIKDILREKTVKVEKPKEKEKKVEWVDDEFLLGAAKEIVKLCEEIEIDILRIVEDDSEHLVIHDIIDKMNNGEELVEMYGDKVVIDIYKKTKKFTEIMNNGDVEVSIDIIDILLDSTSILKTICEKSKASNTKFFYERVKFQLEKLNETIEKNNKNQGRIGDYLREKLNLSDEDIEELLVLQKDKYPGMKLGEIAVREKKASSKEIVEVLRNQSTEKAKIEKKNESSGAYEYIKIPSVKADKLLDILEEMITVQSVLENKISLLYEHNNPVTKEILTMERLIKEVQNVSISFRMVSLKLIFQNLKMTVKDTLKKVSKNARFEIKGEDTEIDRVIANRLLEPLQHLLKNSIAHGIEENSQQRKDVGKNEEAIVSLKAYAEKGYVFLEVSDDGRGINLKKVYEKAIEKKLINENRKYTDDEIVNFIFLPGFSTAEAVDNISGRGVGMDVVRTEISKLGGKITTINTPGQGCKFVLKVPKNMTAMNGTVVTIYGNKYIIPTFYIREIYMVQEHEYVSKLGENKFVKIRNELVPIMDSNKMFSNEMEEKQQIMLILDVEKKIRALPVSEVLEKIDIVVKPLGEEFDNLSQYFGASILGDGNPALIINVENMYKQI